MSLNGFVMTRPYAPDRVGQFLDEAMLNIWAVDSYQTSVYAFQGSAKYQSRSPTPTAWITTQHNSYDLIVRPLMRQLIDLKVEIKTRHFVVGASVATGSTRVTSIAVLEVIPGSAENPSQTLNLMKKDVDNLIIAVPRFDLRPLMDVQVEMAEVVASMGKFGSPALFEPPLSAPPTPPFLHDQPIAFSIPDLISAGTDSGAPLAMIYVPFNKQLPDIPVGYVGLKGSQGSLTFINVPYLARQLDAEMVLAIGISTFSDVPSWGDYLDMNDILTMQNPEGRVLITAALHEFGMFMPFDPETVIWEKVVLKANTCHQLYLNTVGSRRCAPHVTYPALTNLFFAVGTKENPVQIATVETAVIGGLQAASALWERNSAGPNPIVWTGAEEYSPALLWAMKIMLAPWAMGAKYLSDAEDVCGWLRRTDHTPPSMDVLNQLAAAMQKYVAFLDSFQPARQRQSGPPAARDARGARTQGRRHRAGADRDAGRCHADLVLDPGGAAGAGCSVVQTVNCAWVPQRNRAAQGDRTRPRSAAP